MNLLRSCTPIWRDHNYFASKLKIFGDGDDDAWFNYIYKVHIAPWVTLNKFEEKFIFLYENHGMALLIYTVYVSKWLYWISNEHSRYTNKQSNFMFLNSWTNEKWQKHNTCSKHTHNIIHKLNIKLIIWAKRTLELKKYVLLCVFVCVTMVRLPRHVSCFARNSLNILS